MKMNKKEPQYLLTEDNVLDAYKKLIGFPMGKELTDDEIKAIKKRFYELAEYKRKVL